jgi:hypothetical protein
MEKMKEAVNEITQMRQSDPDSVAITLSQEGRKNKEGDIERERREKCRKWERKEEQQSEMK